MTMEKLMSEARHGKTSRDMPYRYNSLISFGDDILNDKIQLTEKKLVKFLSEYVKYVWDTEKYGGYDFDIAQKLYGQGLKIFEKFNLYKYIGLHCDLFYGYSYSSESPEIKEIFEVFNKKYDDWVNAGRPEGEYIRRENYYK
jgi:hypothetical protein